MNMGIEGNFVRQQLVRLLIRMDYTRNRSVSEILLHHPKYCDKEQKR